MKVCWATCWTIFSSEILRKQSKKVEFGNKSTILFHTFILQINFNESQLIFQFFSESLSSSSEYLILSHINWSKCSSCQVHTVRESEALLPQEKSFAIPSKKNSPPTGVERGLKASYFAPWSFYQLPPLPFIHVTILAYSWYS